MTKNITNHGQWKAGQSGNPGGRPAKHRALTEILRLKGEAPVVIGGETILAQEALAKAVWQFVVTGEVWLHGKRLEAQNVSEWANVVKWLYNHIEAPQAAIIESEAEMVVRVVREDAVYPEPSRAHGQEETEDSDGRMRYPEKRS